MDEDRKFAARIAAGYAPPPMTPARAAAFDRALAARRAARPRWPLLALPALGAAAAAAWLLTAGPAPAPAAPAAETYDWSVADEPSLPPDYEVLAMLYDVNADPQEETP
jgi:hypothetical protein